MRIIGIDPGTRITGYGLIDFISGSYTILDYGCIRPPPKDALADRYRAIYEGLCELMDRYQPDAVAVETQFMQKNFQSAMKLGMARGMVLLAASQRGITIFEYPPSKAKLAVVGHGGASKEQVAAMVQKLLLLSKIPTPEDAADALALAICHAQNSLRQKLTEKMV